MAMNLQDWANLAAIVSAMAEVYRTGKEEFQSFYDRFLKSPGIAQDARLLSKAFVTYEEDEVEAIAERIKRCRDRFKEEGSGEARLRCLCSVLRDVKDGNGGTIPKIDHWRAIYDQLNCAV